MDNKEFEKKLEQIKTFKEVPISVDEKIQNAFNRIEENEKIEKEVKKSKSKINFSRVLSLAASFVMMVFLAGNGVAYAKGEPNIYSWVLEKIGIQKEYEEIKTDINKTVEDNGVKITLLNAGYDKEELVVGYKIEIKEGFGEDIEEKIEGVCIYDEYVLKDEDGTIIEEYYVSLGNHYVVNKISNEEYILYSIRDTSEINIEDEELYMSVNIYNVQGIDINGAEIEDAELKGKWDFDQVSISFGNKDYKEYVIDVNKTINEECKINSIRVINTKMFSNIYVDIEQDVNYDEYEGTPIYSILLLDGENILVDSINYIGYGGESGIFLEKMQENKTYTIQVRKRIDDPKNAGVIVEDYLLDEFNIELNKQNIIEVAYCVEKDIVTGDGWIINQIKVENTNINSKITLEVDNYIGTEVEQITNKIKNINRFLIRIYDKDNNLIDEKDKFWWGDILVTDRFTFNEEYNIKVYKYICCTYEGEKEIYSTDTYKSEEDLILVSDYNFILK